MPGNSSQDGNHTFCKDFPADLQVGTRGWYFTKDEIDNHSPSRKDGIDRVRESSLRKSYCSFLKDLGMKLRVSPVTTATAMMFCHRFYMRQSHAKNDWQTVATACMFLASKVEDNLRPLRDVTLVAYEIIYKWDPSASERIKQREVYYKQKELILAAENLLLVTIAFDMGIQHPFRPLVGALKRLKISNNDVAKAAWNLLNEWLRTTLCLQYKPHYIAAASLSVAAKLLNFKLPVVDGKSWWLQFDVSPKQLEEVTQQMLRYFKNDEKQKVPQVALNVMKPTLKIENGASQSAQSSITVGSDPKEEAAPVASLEQKSYSCNTVESNKIMVNAASEHDEKQKAPQVPVNVMNPNLKVENATSQSTQSGITVSFDPEEEAARVASRQSRDQKPQSCKYGGKFRTESNNQVMGNDQVIVKAAPEYQSSDCCSGISSVVDFESVDTSSKIAHVDDALSKIDVDRLKGAFQRTKRVKCNKNKVVAIAESELDIESELEKGVEVEYAAAVKKQKVFHN